jgi:hypothetical protein
VKPPRDSSERTDPAKTDAERIAAALSWGDCAYLDAYIRQEKTDPNLKAQAAAEITRYASPDSHVGMYKTGVMEPQVRLVPKELIDKTSADPAGVLPAIVSSLTADVSDEFLKAKILHDWICDVIAYDADMYISGVIADQDYESVLKKKKAVCSGYVNLYNQMCELAHIESMGVNGYSKGFSYKGKIGKDIDCSWNAVKIGGKWYPVDVTWDAGSVEKKTFIKRYATAWLFADPRSFLYSHWPEEEAYQFYAPVLTADDFMREAYIPGAFFQYGLTVKTKAPEYSALIDKPLVFEITAQNSAVSVSSVVRTAQQREVAGASWQIRNGETITFEFDVPDTAEYKGGIVAKLQNQNRLQDRISIQTFEQIWLPGAEKLFAESEITEDELEYFKKSYYKVTDNSRYYFLEDSFDIPRNNAVVKIHTLLGLSAGLLEETLTFNLQAAPGYQGFGNDVLKYPHTLPGYTEVSNTQLLSPTAGILKSGSSETFTVSTGDFTALAIVINGVQTRLAKNDAGIFELNFTIPSGIDSLTLFGSADERQYTGLIQYSVTN